MGVWNRIKSWMPELTERVGKVGVWKRLDLALLKGTKGMQAIWGWEEAKVEGRKAGEERGRLDGELEGGADE